MKRRLKLVGKILLALVAVFVIFLLVERIRGQKALARYKRELIRQGEKLTAQEVMAQRPKGENGMPDVRAARNRIKDGVVLPNRYPPAMAVTASGRAIIGFQLESWVEDKLTNRWEQLAIELNQNATTLNEIRTALAKPVLDNELDLSDGAKLKFPPFGEIKVLTQWFRAECQLALRNGRPADAVIPLVANIKLPKLLREDRLAISELVRYAIGAMAKVATWEALQADGWLDADLAQIQSAWMEQGFVGDIASALEGERVYTLSIYGTVRSSNDDAFDLIFGMEDFLAIFGDDSGSSWWRDKLEQVPGYQPSLEFLQRNTFCRLWRFAWLDQDEFRYLKRMQTLLEAARNANQLKSQLAVQPTINALESESEHLSFYDRLRFPMQQTIFPLTRLSERATRAELDRSLAIAAIALKRNSLRYGKFPATLAALVPEFITSVPVDYMDGQSIRYRLNSDGSFTLYSVGKDGKDDGGDLTPPAGLKSKDLWRRRDYVWPAPASAEEVEEYRREAGKN